jgi:uncharacterized repeat protein (TIGR01451 family)
MSSSALRGRGVVDRLLLLGSLLVIAGLLAGSGLPGALVPGTAPRADGTQSEAASGPAQRAAIDAAYGRLPLHFEANQGQVDPAVQFLARGSGYTLFLTPEEAVLRLRGAGSGAEGETAGDAVLRQALLGARPSATAEGSEELPARAHYFRGVDPAAWRTDVPIYARVRYDQVYPGIDLVYYGTQRELEYDFLVAPGADPGQIALGFTGAEHLAVDPAGDLVLQVGGREVRHRKPVAYQEIDGVRQDVTARYEIHSHAASAPTQQGTASGRTQPVAPLDADLVVPNGVQQAAPLQHAVGFALGRYEPNLPLVIDPVLSYATYLGGSGWDSIQGIAVDSAGNAYLAGYTCSTDFPILGPLDPSYAGGSTTCNGSPNLGDAFVAKLNPTGTALFYSAYLGGSDDDGAKAIAVDASGNAYVAGDTRSSDFPKVGTQLGFCFGGGGRSPFVTKINAAGNALVYSICGVGGAAIAVDAANAVYTADSFEIWKIHPSGGSLVYHASLGFGSNNVNGIAVDAAGNAYVAGETNGGLTTVNAFQPTHGGGFWDAFVAKLDPTGTTFLYLTYLGGSANDLARGLAVDALGSAYVTGTTASTNFPTANALQGTYGGGTTDAFITKLSPSGAALVYSTYLGGSGNGSAPPFTDDAGDGIAVDAAGNVYVGGSTVSANFRLQSPLQSAKSSLVIGDGFLIKLNPAGSALAFATFVGGSGFSQAFVDTLAVDGNGNVYLGGLAGHDLPTTPGAVQPVCGNPAGGPTACSSGPDGFVMRINDTPTTRADLVVTHGATPNPAIVGQRVTYALTVTNLGPNTATGVTLLDSLPANMAFVEAHASQGGCTMTATLSCALGTIANGANVTVTLVTGATAVGALANVASVASDQADPVAANSTSSLTVPISAAPPPNDAFAGVQAGCAPLGSTVWYTLTSTTTGPVTVSTYGSDFDTVLAVYAGTTLGGLSLLACSDDAGLAGGRTLQSQLTFSATMGTPYQVQVGGYQGAAGSLVLDFAGAPPTPPAAPTILRQGPLVAQQYGVTINTQALVTNSPNVTLSLSAKPGTTQMYVSNSPTPPGGFEAFAASKAWTLAPPSPATAPTVVYVWFRDGGGNVTGPFADDILLVQSPPTGAASIAARHTASVASVSLNAAANVVPVTEMRLSGDPGFAGASFQPFFTSATVNPAGSDKVYVQFRDAAGNVSTLDIPTSPKLPSLGVSPASTSPGSTISVTWGDVPNASGTNWIGLFAAGADDRTALAERFTNGQIGGSGSFVLPSPLAAGNYELRLFAQKGVTRLAASPALSVGSGGGGPSPTPTSPPTATSVVTACQPRAAIGVSSVDNGDGRLRVTVTAGGAGNTLQTISFTTDSQFVPNALIEAGTTGRQAPFSVTPNSASYTFYVRRVNAGQAATVPFTVQDGCGSWPTFVGGGAAAWSGAPPPAAGSAPVTTAAVPTPTPTGLPAPSPTPTVTSPPTPTATPPPTGRR